MLVGHHLNHQSLKLMLTVLRRGTQASREEDAFSEIMKAGWLIGSACNLGRCTSLHAELWAVLLGLQTTWEKGYMRIILETDSAIVHLLLKSPDSTRLVHDVLVSKCMELLRRSLAVEVLKIHQEANFVADGVANWALTHGVDYYILHAPPVRPTRVSEEFPLR